MTSPLPQLAAISVIADRFPDGTYGATVSINADLTYSLPGPRARRYATALMEASVACEHDAALYHTLAARGIPDHMTAVVLTEVRATRPVDNRWTAPLLLGSILTAAEPHLPVLRCIPEGGQDGWQWTPAEARRHAWQVLSAVAAAEEDNRVAAVLGGPQFGLPEGTVAAVIDAMQGHWPDAEDRA
jgi:hypothetical protein